MTMVNHESFTKYERARILGARALQVAMNAPILVKINKTDLEKINFDALKIAEIEFSSDVLPISVDRPLPKMKEGRLKRTKTPKISDLSKDEVEEKIEKEIIEEGEIMELARPDDEEDLDEGSSGTEE